MKKYLYYSILVAILVSGSMSAMAAKKKMSDRRKYSQDIHLVSFWGGAGYSGLVNNYSKSDNLSFTYDLTSGTYKPQFLGGGGGMIGVGYELHHKKFIFSVGPEFRVLSSRDNFHMLDANGEKFSMIDYTHPEYSSMVQHFDIQRYHETNVVGQIMLPIMFGANFEKFYFLAGGKVGYSIFGHYHQRAKITSSVTDEMAVDDWYEIYSHFLQKEQLGKHPLYQQVDGVKPTFKGKNNFGLDATVSAEFGVNINEFMSATWQKENMKKKYPLHMRAAAFIDYGIPNMYAMSLAKANQTNTDMLTFVPGVDDGGYAVEKFFTTSVHKSQIARGAGAFNARVNSLLVGVKFTALLQLNKPKIPNPRLLFWVTDAFTDNQPTKSIARVAVHQQGRKRPQQKAMKRDGKLAPRLYRGMYKFSATAPGYLESDTIQFDHQQDLKDTIHFALIPVPKNVFYIHDANTEALIPASITLISHESEDKRSGSTTAEQTSLEMSLKYGNTYDVVVSAPGYHSDTLALSDLYDQNVNYYLRPIIRVRHKLILKHMYFATDKTDILPMSEDDILTLYNFLKDNPKIRVLITGHTDSQGSEEHNQKLSEGRSESLKNEMIKRGIAADRMETDGKGELEPIDTNATDAGRQNNRRVEVTVLNEEEAEEDIF